jgi:hypothetical protein
MNILIFSGLRRAKIRRGHGTEEPLFSWIRAEIVDIPARPWLVP